MTRSWLDKLSQPFETIAAGELSRQAIEETAASEAAHPSRNGPLAPAVPDPPHRPNRDALHDLLQGQDDPQAVPPAEDKALHACKGICANPCTLPDRKKAMRLDFALRETGPQCRDGPVGDGSRATARPIHQRERSRNAKHATMLGPHDAHKHVTRKEWQVHRDAGAVLPFAMHAIKRQEMLDVPLREVKRNPLFVPGCRIPGEPARLLVQMGRRVDRGRCHGYC